MNTTYSHIKLGKDLRTFVMELLEQQDRFPKLIDYLASLWAVAERYKDAENVDFALIARMLEEAFHTKPKKIDWNKEREVAQNYPQKVSQQLDEETKGYVYFEKNIRNQLLELKEMKRWFRKPLPGWENLSTDDYLERGTVNYEFDNEIFKVDWTELNHIIHERKYNQ